MIRFSASELYIMHASVLKQSRLCVLSFQLFKALLAFRGVLTMGQMGLQPQAHTAQIGPPGQMLKIQFLYFKFCVYFLFIGRAHRPLNLRRLWKGLRIQ